MNKYQKLLRKMRQRIFDYEGTPNEEKASRVLRKVKARYMVSPEAIRAQQISEHAQSERMLRLWA